jgi:hypothetical protein
MSGTTPLALLLGQAACVTLAYLPRNCALRHLYSRCDDLRSDHNPLVALVAHAPIVDAGGSPRHDTQDVNRHGGGLSLH